MRTARVELARSSSRAPGSEPGVSTEIPPRPRGDGGITPRHGHHFSPESNWVPGFQAPCMSTMLVSDPCVAQTGFEPAMTGVKDRRLTAWLLGHVPGRYSGENDYTTRPRSGRARARTETRRVKIRLCLPSSHAYTWSDSNRHERNAHWTLIPAGLPNSPTGACARALLPAAQTAP